MVSNEVKDAAPAKLVVTCNAASRYGNETCHCQPAFDTRHSLLEGNEEGR
jgi:hypothetical protein